MISTRFYFPLTTKWRICR